MLVMLLGSAAVCCMQDMFWEDDRVLFISIHQDSNYPLNSGAAATAA
jgi:acetoin utilization deacetylase AcuC-like enzyme